MSIAGGGGVHVSSSSPNVASMTAGGHEFGANLAAAAPPAAVITGDLAPSLAHSSARDVHPFTFPSGGAAIVTVPSRAATVAVSFKLSISRAAHVTSHASSAAAVRAGSPTAAWAAGGGVSSPGHAMVDEYEGTFNLSLLTLAAAGQRACDELVVLRRVVGGSRRESVAVPAPADIDGDPRTEDDTVASSDEPASMLRRASSTRPAAVSDGGYTLSSLDDACVRIVFAVRKGRRAQVATAWAAAELAGATGRTQWRDRQ